MYSSKTITLLQLIINIGYELKYFPFKLIKTKGIPKLQHLAYTNKYITWKPLLFIIATIQFIILLLGFWYDIAYYTPADERAQFFVCLPYLIAGILSSFILLLKYKHYVLIFNTFGKFGNKLRKYLLCNKKYIVYYLTDGNHFSNSFSDIFHKTNSTTKDGLEILLMLFSMSLPGLSLMTLPVTFILLFNGTHMWELLATNCFMIDLLISIFASFVS